MTPTLVPHADDPAVTYVLMEAATIGEVHAADGRFGIAFREPGASAVTFLGDAFRTAEAAVQDLLMRYEGGEIEAL